MGFFYLQHDCLNDWDLVDIGAEDVVLDWEQNLNEAKKNEF